ncbi:MAG: sensor histidine kinase [Angelakisella sp.]
MLGKLCKAYTDLTDEDIGQLKELERNIQYVADLTDSDIFINCLVNEGTAALVVAQAKPMGSGSAYVHEVVGKTAVREYEPAVFNAFESEMPVRDLKAITQENISVKQDVAPIRNKQGKVIAVLIREKDVSSYLLQDRKYEKMARTMECIADPLIGGGQSEMELAIRESHHRVKNNLQMVASILNMQARSSDNPEVKQAFKENVSRVLSIASIHDMLTSGGNSEQVEIKPLIDRLCRNIRSILPENKNITITVEGDDAVLASDRASSVALCVNELITNAVTHAYPDRRDGQVAVQVHSGNLYYTISVCDNGVGFYPEDTGRGSLGLSIVRATVEDKLGGELKIASDKHGTRVLFEFRKSATE